MNTRMLASITLATCIGYANLALADAATDNAAVAAALVGSWDLVSLENRGEDGSVHKPFGDAPLGRITYTADGRMTAQIMRDVRKTFATDQLYSGTADEKAAAYDSYIAYYGTYTVDAAKHTVTHTVEASLFPNWVGGQQQRFYTLDGEQLILSTAPFPAHGTVVTPRVVWRRAP